MRALKISIILCLTLLMLVGCSASADTYQNVMELTKKYDREKNLSSFLYDDGYRMLKKGEFGIDLKSYDYSHEMTSSKTIYDDPSLIVFGADYKGGTAVLRTRVSGETMSDTFIDIFDEESVLKETIEVTCVGTDIKDSFIGDFDYLYDDIYLIEGTWKFTLWNSKTNASFDVETRDYQYAYIGDGIMAMTIEDEETGKSNIALLDIEAQKIIDDYKYENSRIISLTYDKELSKLIVLTKTEIIGFDIDNGSIKEESVIREVEVPHMTGFGHVIRSLGDKLVMLAFEKNIGIYEEKRVVKEAPEKDLVELDALHGHDYYDYVEKFNAQTDGPKIKINDFDGDYERYQNQIGTSMMSGDGPELFTPFPFDLRGLYKKGLILDINELAKVDTRLDISKLESTIIDGCSYEGKLLTMPFAYSIDSWVYDLRDISDEFAKVIKDEDLDPYTLKEYLIKENSNGFNAKIKISEEELACNLVNSTFSKLWDSEGRFKDDADKILKEAMLLAMDYKKSNLLTEDDNAIINQDLTGSYSKLFFLKHKYNNQFSLKLPITMEDGENDYNFHVMNLSVNSNISDIQKKAICDYFVFFIKEQEKEIEREFMHGFMFPIGSEFGDTYRQKVVKIKEYTMFLLDEMITETAVDEKSIIEIDNLIENVKIDVTRDYKIYLIVDKEVSRYIREEISLEEAVENIMSKYETYRSEQY